MLGYLYVASRREFGRASRRLAAELHRPDTVHDSEPAVTARRRRYGKPGELARAVDGDDHQDAAPVLPIADAWTRRAAALKQPGVKLSEAQLWVLELLVKGYAPAEAVRTAGVSWAVYQNLQRCADRVPSGRRRGVATLDPTGLKARMAAGRLTQAAAARRIGVARELLNRHVNGRGTLTPEQTRKLENLLAPDRPRLRTRPPGSSRS